MPSDHLILYHSHLLLPSIFPSIGVFSNESFLHISWLKSWSFSFSISPSNKYSGLISFRIDWFDLFRQPRLGLEYNQPWNHISKKKKKKSHFLPSFTEKQTKVLPLFECPSVYPMSLTVFLFNAFPLLATDWFLSNGVLQEILTSMAERETVLLI